MGFCALARGLLDVSSIPYLCRLCFWVLLMFLMDSINDVLYNLFEYYRKLQ